MHNVLRDLLNCKNPRNLNVARLSTMNLLCLNLPGKKFPERIGTILVAVLGRQRASQPWELLTLVYLALFPTLPEDLPVVFVAGVVETQKSPIAEPGVRGMGIQHIQPHHHLLHLLLGISQVTGPLCSI